MKVLFLFIDGVGLRDAATDNPVNPEVCPALCRLISAHSKPIDACLGVGGPPQSATGQGTMFTGVNCAAAMGKHCEGFPGPGLRKIIESDNLFLRLKARGKRVCFSDAYLVDSPDELAARRFKSVTTVMALTAPETIRTVDDLSCGRAVMQDLTRETIQDRWPDISVIPPQRAAEHLDYARACAVLRTYDRFLASLVRFTEAAGITLVMTSDHGNVENISERGHTTNKVPFIAFGPKERFLRDRVESLVDVTPAIVAAYD